MDKDKLMEQAENTAEKMALRMQAAYIRSVERNSHYYIDAQGADEDDFFAWLEGYDWSEVSNAK